MGDRLLARAQHIRDFATTGGMQQAMPRISNAVVKFATWLEDGAREVTRLAAEQDRLASLASSLEGELVEAQAEYSATAQEQRRRVQELENSERRLQVCATVQSRSLVCVLVPIYLCTIFSMDAAVNSVVLVSSRC